MRSSGPFKSLPNNKILDLTKLKAFADDKKKLFFFERLETVGKGQKAG